MSFERSTVKPDRHQEMGSEALGVTSTKALRRVDLGHLRIRRELRRERVCEGREGN